MAGTPPHLGPTRGRTGWRLGAVVCAAALALAWPARAQDEPAPADRSLAPPPLQAFLDDIEDDKPIANAGNERHAYNALLVFCFRDITPDQIAATARHDVTYAHMANPIRSAYRGQPVHLEGRLKRVIKYPPPDDLKASGLTEIYESWIFPGVGNSTHPVVLLTPRAAPGVKAEGDTEGWVRVDAYFFKRYAYEARNDKGKPVTLGAPLLIGPILPAVSPPAAAGAFWSPAVIGGVVLVVAAAVVIVWLVRRADRRVRSRLEVSRTGNPFAEPPRGPARPGAPHSLEN
jgi:hypothetical protein